MANEPGPPTPTNVRTPGAWLPDDGLTRAFALTTVILLLATLAGLPAFGSVIGFGETRELIELPWFLPMAESYVVLAAFAIAFLSLGRYAALGGAWAYWAGAIFLANATLSTFYLLAWPGLLGDRGLIARLPNTSAWFFCLTFTCLAFLLLVQRAGTSEKPEPPTKPYMVYSAVAAFALLLGWLSLRFEDALPVFVVAGRFNTLTFAWVSLTDVLLFVAAIAAYRRYRRERDQMLGYLALFLLLIAFGLAYSVLGGKRYDIWWYAARLVYGAAYLVMLFGLLQEGYALLTREKLRAEERARWLTIEQRAHAETERRAAETVFEWERLQAIVNSMVDEVWFIDAGGGATLLNPGAVPWLGLELPVGSAIDMERLLGSLEIMLPDGRPRPVEETPAVRSLLGEVVRSHDEVVRHVATGELRHRQISSAPVRGHDGRIVGAVAVIRDVTHLKRAEEERDRLLAAEREARAEAERALRTREQFLAVASHELKTPLTVLLGHTQAILRRARRDGGLRARDEHALNRVVEQANKLNRMIVALLDISRLESGQLSLAREPLDLCALAADVVAQVEPTVTGQVMDLRVPVEPVMVLGDPLRLEQVLQNLVQNAIKYSLSGGTITLTLSQQDGVARLSVTDQGIGIPQEALPRLFSRFYRAPNSEAQHIAGIGLGLYVVKEIVALHGGTVSVDSREGAGSTFTIELPLHDVPMTATGASQT